MYRAAFARFNRSCQTSNDTPPADNTSGQNIMEQSVRQHRNRIVILDLVALTLLAAACGVASGIVLAGITLLFAGQS